MACIKMRPLYTNPPFAMYFRFKISTAGHNNLGMAFQRLSK
jgi:hypothetical protein